MTQPDIKLRVDSLMAMLEKKNYRPKEYSTIAIERTEIRALVEKFIEKESHTDKLLEMAAAALKNYANDCVSTGDGDIAREALLTLQQHGFGKE